MWVLRAMKWVRVCNTCVESHVHTALAIKDTARPHTVFTAGAPLWGSAYLSTVAYDCLSACACLFISSTSLRRAYAYAPSTSLAHILQALRQPQATRRACLYPILKRVFIFRINLSTKLIGCLFVYLYFDWLSSSRLLLDWQTVLVRTCVHVVGMCAHLVISKL